jgi:transcriptional regulator with XRE-family HTH domain
MRRKTVTPLQMVRRARTINQTDLARMAGVTQETISKAERGVLRLRPEVQERIATILGASVSALFGTTDEDERASA